LKIRHGTIVDNVVPLSYVCANFDDDRLWNEKALADRKSDNNNTNTNKNNNKNNVGPKSTKKRSNWLPFARIVI